jgi:UDP-N-acetylglucosamine 1-carboxyvinyltransferase
MGQILHSLGATAVLEGDKLVIGSKNLQSHTIPERLMREMRSSIILMGPILARMGRVSASYPGGCAIGSRPIDLHLKGLQAMGAKIEEEGRGYITAEASILHGADIHLDYPSVGATENLMMAATLAEGDTVIRNAAKEPEVLDLQNFLCSLGAVVEGAGSDCVRIRGVTRLTGSAYHIIPDRIAAGTYLLAGVMTRGEVTVYPVIPEHLEPLLCKLREMNVAVTTSADAVTIRCPERPEAVDMVRTLPHPGFPTDLQAPMMAALCLARGTSVVSETVFESRFKHVDELRRMGANIKVEGRTAIVRGVESLRGAVVSASDLRAGAGLVMAGLAAEGITVVEMVHHIDRGYVKLDSELRALGARIERLGW